MHKLVEIKNNDTFIIEMMYASVDNMTGIDVYNQIGFGNVAYVHQDVWYKLKNVIPILKRLNLKMKICDAFRPISAHKRLKEIIPIDGFFAISAERSQHCRATAIDVVLCDMNGVELKYPTNVDAYDKDLSIKLLNGDSDEFMKYLKLARHDYQDEAMQEEIKNRIQLKSIMESIGFDALVHEWWHYNLSNGKDEIKYPALDI